MAVKSETTRITKRVVDGLAPGETIWDSEIRGFGVRCQRRDKVYMLKTRVAGRQRWFTIGQHGSPWTSETARARARKMLTEIAAGQDLAALRQEGRVTPPSMTDLCRRYMEEHAREHKKASSAYTDESNIKNHVLPLLGRMRVVDVTRADVDRFKRDVKDGRTADKTGETRLARHGGVVVRGGPGVANRCLTLLSKMFNLAERWGWRAEGSNPVRHVERYKENKRERYLSTQELARLGEGLTRAEEDGTASPFAVAAIRMLLFTGARLSEVLTLKWKYVDLERCILELPDSKTGRKTIYLSAPALAVLANAPRVSDNPFVIVGERKGAHLVNLQKPWSRIRVAAGLEDLRMHDLRHSFASVAAASGLSLPIIGRLLGHAKAATTERYAHLAADPIRAANEAVASKIAISINGNSTALEGRGES